MPGVSPPPRHPEQARSRQELLHLCVVESVGREKHKGKRGMNTFVDQGAILEQVTLKRLTPSSAEFLRKLCGDVAIRSYWCGTTADMERVTGTTMDTRKKAMKRLQERKVLRVVTKANKHADFWLIKICPVYAWRGFGDAWESALRERLTKDWTLFRLKQARRCQSAGFDTYLGKESLNHGGYRGAVNSPMYI